MTKVKAWPKRRRRHKKCLNGHLMDPDNIYIRQRDGYEVCKTCRRDRVRQCRERKHGRSGPLVGAAQ